MKAIRIFRVAFFVPMAGIYIHIPFCKQQCTYCDFHFSTTFESYRSQMVNAIATELHTRIDYLEGRSIESIYFGGGTPSILNEQELSLLLTDIRANYQVNPEAEITLETNPDDITQEKLTTWKNAGVNRLSIGLQSFKAEDLEWMNRAHTADESRNCAALAKAHNFENLTVDLMYGLPNLSNEEWKNHVLQVIEMGVTHISAYCLTVEEKTVLNKWVQEGKIYPASENQQSEQFLLLVETLEEHGFEQYEISNFCRPGHEAVHNSNYWKGEWYIGVGPSAHSFNGTSRSWNIANNQKYMLRIAENEAFFETEILSKKDQYNELLLTGLRTKYGVSLKTLATLRVIPESTQLKIGEFKTVGWMTEKNGVLALTKSGRLKADYIAAELFLDANE